MNGNNSLKCILCRLFDLETGAREIVQQVKDLEVHFATLTHPAPCQLTLKFLQTNSDFNPCAERWKNMKEELTNRMWGIFNETGVFMAFCRYGFTLTITNMVQSGEQCIITFKP